MATKNAVRDVHSAWRRARPFAGPDSEVSLREMLSSTDPIFLEGGSEPGVRDCPLLFNHAIHPDYLASALTSLGIRLPSSRDKRVALNYLITEAVMATRHGRWLSYSRRTNWYTGLSWYFGRAFTYAAVVPTVDDLVSAGFVRHDRGMWRSNGTGLQSAIQATPPLIEAVLDAPVRHCPVVQPVWLRRRTEDKELVAYKHTAQTICWRRQLDRFNDHLAAISVRVGSKALVPSLHRVFSGSFDLGGRLYGSFQNIRRDIRQSELTVNGSRACEADIAQLHPSLLYAEEGVRLHGDAYAIAGFERDQAKLAWNVLINAANEREALWAIANHLQKPVHTISNGQPSEEAVERARELKSAIEAKHRPIAKSFCSDAGIRLQRQDSDMMAIALKECVRRDIPALPYHDALLCPRDEIERAAEILHAAAIAKFGLSVCGIRIT